MRRFAVIMGSALSLLAGCAHAARAGEAPSVQALAASSVAQRPERVLITGSRIPRYVEPGTQVLPSDAPVQVFTRDRLLSTGRAHDLGAAIQALDPAIGR